MRVLAFSLLSVLFAFASACANSGSGADAPGDDGGGTSDDAGDGSSPGKDGSLADGGSDGPVIVVSAQQACSDNATAYCTQLGMCAPFLLTLEYGTAATCISRQTPGCLDELSAPGTGWTGNSLESCVKARTALSCSGFFYAKPQPQACEISGYTLTGAACLYGAQCGTGYCKIAGGASCGTCTALGSTGAACTSSADCDGNLACTAATGGTCQPPQPLNGTCDAITHPCAGGLDCTAGVCAGPVDGGAKCSTAAGGAQCDYNQGDYCDPSSMTCLAYTLSPPATCGPATTLCTGGSTCYHSFCVSPVQPGAACDATMGLYCAPPSTCNGGTCSSPSAAQCK